MIGKRAIGSRLLVVGLTVSVLAGCAAPDVSAYEDVRATLDMETGVALYPLDDYALTGDDAVAVEHANALVIQECMADSGLDFPRADQDWSSIAPTPDRFFGLWSRTVAKKYGYDLPPEEAEARLSKLEASKPDAWWDAYWRCLKDSDILPPMKPLTGDPDQPSPVDRGILESLRYTQTSQEFADAKAAWLDCVSDRGLVAQEGAVLVPVLQENNKESQYSVALIDVECKEKLGTIQTIADTMARFQAAYADAHEAELNEFYQRAQDVLGAAREIIATRGG